MPTLGFAQPFTLFRIPALVRVLLAIALAAWTVPSRALTVPFTAGALATAAASELGIGIALALALQIVFAAVLTVGRTLDIQAGLGLAALIDPTTRAGMPLIGTLLAYGAAALFFAGSGPVDLLALWSASVDRLPLGTAVILDPMAVSSLLATAFAIACGLGGAIILALFLCDMAIAFMSRTLPQMNVMVLGFQVKTLVLLTLLPPALSASGTLLSRLLRLAVEQAPTLVIAQ